MRIVFLGAKLPLTKTIACVDGRYTVAPYPHVSKLTSHQEDVTSLAEFEATLRQHALANHCLFNGQLQQPLVDESRRGKTLKGAPREWIVFDFDKIEAKDHADAVARYLPAECQQVSYIVQHSASMFQPQDRPRFSGHIFMLLKRSSDEATLRAYVEHLNFTLPALRQALTLTDSGTSLHWPLDRSATYDSKLIYIAPPRTFGFTPAIAAKDAIRLVKKRQSHLQIPTFTAIDRHEINAMINDLRLKAGFENHDLRTRPFEDGEILIGAEPGVITDIKPMGDHYIKFNLNGGDSLGYWIDLRNPAVIKNFKGEPWLLTKEVDPDVYKALAKTAPRIVSKPPLEEGTEVLAFYATNQNSTIKIGSYAAASALLTLNNATETSAKAWLTEFGVVKSGYLPHMDLIFDPKSDVQFIPGDVRINTFKASKYMTRERSSNKPSSLTEIPSLADKVMRSMLGDPTPEVYAHFINWLAYIFQTRDKTGTAWLLSGRTGTGKGSFIRYILSPLFGSDVVTVKQFGSVTEQFNAYLEKALFVVFDECDTHAVSNENELMAKLRHWITDSPIAIRRMKTDSYDAPSYCNFIFLANKRTGVLMTKDDRRMNIAERQENRLYYTPNEFLALQRGDDLDTLADVLARWPVDAAAVTQVVETQAREDVHEATSTINQLIADAILRGDIQYFLDRTPSDAEAQGDFYNRFNPLGMFKDLIEKCLAAADAGTPMILKDDDLFLFFRTLIPDNRFFQDSKTWRRRHYKTLGLDLDARHRKPGEWKGQERGVMVKWTVPENVEAKPKKQPTTGKVVDIKPVRRGKK